MDLSKFIDYPMWVKFVALIWLISTFILGAAFIFVRPTNKENANLQSQYIQDTKLIIEAKQLSRDLIEFSDTHIKKWESAGPDDKTSSYIEIGSGYANNFQNRVVSVKQEFSKRKLTNKKLTNENIYSPGIYDIKDIALVIDELAVKLESQKEM